MFLFAVMSDDDGRLIVNVAHGTMRRETIGLSGDCERIILPYGRHVRVA
jgi:hypothetical protein